MNNFFTQTIQNFVDFFKSLDMTRRLGMIAVAALVVSLMAGIIIYAGKTDYKVLYTDLTKDDSETNGEDSGIDKWIRARVTPLICMMVLTNSPSRARCLLIF